jgi:predicted phosphodiesterase
MKKKIGVLSDLHLESSNMKLELNCDVLVLAGDISQDFGLLYRFFEQNIPEGMPVIYVPGNHEYEGKRDFVVMEELKKIEKEFPNIHVLQNESIDIEGIRFIGSTLWSNFEGMGITNKKLVKDWCKFNVVDFTYIFKKNPSNIHGAVPYTSWTPDDMEKEFNKAYDFLKYELRNRETELPKFVVTHFAPTIESLDPNFKVGLHSAYWVNNLPELMGFCDYWVHGHTHSSFNYDYEGTKVICNPRGYSKLFDLSQNTKFDRKMYVEVEVLEQTKKIKLK